MADIEHFSDCVAHDKAWAIAEAAGMTPTEAEVWSHLQDLGNALELLDAEAGTPKAVRRAFDRIGEHLLARVTQRRMDQISQDPRLAPHRRGPR